MPLSNILLSGAIARQSHPAYLLVALVSPPIQSDRNCIGLRDPDWTTIFVNKKVGKKLFLVFVNLCDVLCFYLNWQKYKKSSFVNKIVCIHSETVNL